MTYTAWRHTHIQKHQNIIKKLSNLSDNEIIDYFRWDNMIIYERNFCSLYEDNKKCHQMTHLNCYLCACPFFRFDDEGLGEKEGKILYSICTINAKNSKEFHSDNAIHQDCSSCDIPHHKRYIQKNFNRDLSEIFDKKL